MPSQELGIKSSSALTQILVRFPTCRVSSDVLSCLPNAYSTELRMNYVLGTENSLQEVHKAAREVKIGTAK